MLIDWLTIRVPVALLNKATHALWEGRNGYIMAVSGDGEIEWRSPRRESIRSDSHQVMIEPWADQVKVSGSPCRVDQLENVFGSADVVECVRKMLRFADQHTNLGLCFVPLDKISVSRLDVTANYDLGGPERVRQALMDLRHAEGGRYQVRTTSETVYWGQGSKRRSGKAYHKGPQLRRQVRKGQAEVSDHRLDLADRLLRLELQLSAEWHREHREQGHSWQELTEAVLAEMHGKYFGALVGSVEVVEMDRLLERLEGVAGSPGKALAAFRTWGLVRAVGAENAAHSMARSTWLRHRKALFEAGLSWADLQAGNVVPLRRDPLVLSAPVRGWAELERAA